MLHYFKNADFKTSLFFFLGMMPRYNFPYSLFLKKFLNSQCGQLKPVVFIHGCFGSKGN